MTSLMEFMFMDSIGALEAGDTFQTTLYLVLVNVFTKGHLVTLSCVGHPVFCWSNTDLDKWMQGL